jgi:anti-sigma factor ChrR (cupin superfamily)
MHDRWMERLSEYLDGEMDPAERVSLETHLGECAECAAVLEGLGRVRARAKELSRVPVPQALWPRIEAAIALGSSADAATARVVSRKPGGRRFFSLPELLAACLAVAIVSGGVVYALLRHRPHAVEPGPVIVARAHDRPVDVAPSVSAAIEPAVRTVAGTVHAARAEETPHEEAVSELRKVLARQRDQLDPATIRTLESNLAIIDLAIDQARRALAADSANTYVREHLAETMRRRVELLHRATMLASTSEETR